MTVLSPIYTSLRITEFLITQLLPTYAATRNKTVLHLCPRIILGRRKIVDLCFDSRFLSEEIITDLRLQKCHIGTIISFCIRNITPVILCLITINSFQVFVTDQDVIYKIMSAFLCSPLDQFDQQPSSYNVNTC